MRLQATAHNKASQLALEIFSDVLDAVNSENLVSQALELVGDALFVQGEHIDLSNYDHVWLAGAGKAAMPMVRAAKSILGNRVTGGLVITKEGSGSELEGIEVLESSHPIPDAKSLQAGQRMLEFAMARQERDLVLFFLSGGASALMESLQGGLNLDDLQATNEWLLGSGLDITAMNQIRTRLSRLKGGRLATAFYPATVAVVVLSDVVGNHLPSIGSGPFTPPVWVHAHFPFNEAGRLPKRVIDTLSHSYSPLPPPVPVPHYVIGSVSLAIHAAAESARRHGLTSLPYADPLSGEARTMARKIVRHALAAQRDNFCMIFGGETTVHLRSTGFGGRCQEMAVAASERIVPLSNSCFLAAGTDGYDGPTDAIGGIVDPLSLTRARTLGHSVRKALNRHESYSFLTACDGLIKTGPTGSNVNDIVLLVQAPNMP